MVGRSAWTLCVGIVVLTAGAAAADEQPNAVSGLVADLEQTVLAPDGRPVSVTVSKLLLADSAARVEAASEPERAGYHEYQLYDFARGKLYRVFPDERIYFESALSPAAAATGFVEGWAPRPAGLAVRTIPLKDDPIDGAPARLELLEHRSGRGPSVQYAFVWRSDPPGRLPRRVVYTPPGGHTIVLGYRDVHVRSVDPAAFAVPNDFVNLSPF